MGWCSVKPKQTKSNQTKQNQTKPKPLHRDNITPPPNKYSGYDTKQPDSEALVLKLWGMWSTLSLPLLPGPLWPRVVIPVGVILMGQIELFILETICMQIELLVLDTCIIIKQDLYRQWKVMLHLLQVRKSNVTFVTGNEK